MDFEPTIYCLKKWQKEINASTLWATSSSSTLVCCMFPKWIFPKLIPILFNISWFTLYGICYFFSKNKQKETHSQCAKMEHDRCCVSDNDCKCPDKLIVSSNVTSVMWHMLPKDNIKRRRWVKLISKSRADFEPGN